MLALLLFLLIEFLLQSKFLILQVLHHVLKFDKLVFLLLVQLMLQYLGPLLNVIFSSFLR